MIHFNPRSPCGERQILDYNDITIALFQSTLPVWGATGYSAPTSKSFAISIHAPRVGSDPLQAGKLPAVPYFNPRSPCGERRLLTYSDEAHFLISIHAPRVGSDS